MDSREELRPGMTIKSCKDIYIISELIGRGGSSLVYKAIRQSDQLIMIIKETFPLDRNSGIRREQEGQKIYIDYTLPNEIVT